MAGIEQLDLGPVGPPQLSSTERRGQEDQINEQRKEDTAVSAIYSCGRKLSPVDNFLLMLILANTCIS